MLAAQPLRLSLVAALLALGLSAQDATPAPTLSPAPPSLMQQFDVAVASLEVLQFLPAGPGAARVDVVLGGQARRLDLHLHDVRSPQFRLFERLAGGGLQGVPVPPCVTYRGVLVGDAGSEVAATIDGGSITAFLRTGAGELWVVQPVRQVVPSAGAALHIVFRGLDGVPLPTSCGVQVPTLPVPPVGGQDAVYACDMAIEADYPFYQLNGSSTTNTQNDVTGIVNAMDVIYQRDVQVALQISQLIVDSAPDPYTTSIPNTLLAQFQSRWNTTYAGVVRDVAHLFTGRNIGAASGGVIGIAIVGTVCNLGSAYGLSQSRFSANYAYRVGVTAHELGHCFGASHCNAYSPCNIMCSGIGGCSNNPSAFGPTEQNQIIAYRQTVGCLPLQLSMPVITGATPTSVATINPPQVTLTGTGFTGTTSINVGPTWVTSGIQVVSDTQLRFTPPAGLPLAFQLVSAVNSAGTSNNWPLLYTEANPCEIVVPTVVIGGNTMTWSMGGRAHDLGVLLISITNTTSPWLGFPLLDGAAILWQGGLDASGLATYSFPVPAQVLNGLRGYFQMIDIGPPLTVQSVSAIKSTLILF